MWSGAVLAVVVPLCLASLSILGCAPEAADSARGSSASPPASRGQGVEAAPASGSEPETPEQSAVPPRGGGSGGAETDASPLGLFGPVFPTPGGGSGHSSRCDPFEEDAESCF